MRHLDLFAGIGGFSLAARMAGWETVAHCEINPYCQQVLHKHFPNAKLHADIKELDGTQYRGTVDIITGGFPCQPYSSAGKRLGKDDERHLWPENRRVYREVAPSWIVGENVLGLVNWNGGLVFEEVQADLESDGYEVMPYILPAAGVGAPHRRNRVWFVAYSYSNDARRRRHGQAGPAATKSKREAREQRIRAEFERVGEEGVIADPKEFIKREQADKVNSIANERGTWPIFGSSNEYNPWDEFPTQSGVCGGDDGISNRMERLKALGNAIVPQVAYQIFKAINQYNSL